MPGIRLHHDTLRNVIMAVECKRKYKQPFLCPTCGVTHEYKTVHLKLDNDGDVIVSKGVWDKDLKGHPALGLTAENEVSNPPALIIGGPETDQVAMEILAQSYNGRR